MLCGVKHTIEGWGWVPHCVSLTLQGNRWAHDPFTGRAMLMRSRHRAPEVPSATWALPSSLTPPSISILSLCSGPWPSLPPTPQLHFCSRLHPAASSACGVQFLTSFRPSSSSRSTPSQCLCAIFLRAPIMARDSLIHLFPCCLSSPGD